MPIDDVVLNFDPTAQAILNVVLALVMLGVALDLRASDFGRLLQSPWPVALGLFSQFVFLPAATFLFVILVQPTSSIALGLMLVAACPGGNLSNFVTQRACGNVALSVSLTGIATSLALLLTPLNLAFWASLYGPTAQLLTETSVDPRLVAITVGALLLMPLAIGMTINAMLPGLATRLRGPIRFISLFVFAIFVFGALAANFGHFLDHARAIVFLVFAHNAVAVAGGYAIATAGRLSEADRRAVSIETGIQNSGLGLILVLNFFGGLGGMAIVAAWWGIWHLISGFALAEFFRRKRSGPVEVVT